MEILLDSGNIESIKKANEFYGIDGVTTNPTIISKEKADFFQHLKKIRSIIGKEKMLHVQAVSLNAENMIEEAKHIVSQLGENVFVKIPVIPEGIKAIRLLHEQGIHTTATAIFTNQQAIIAMKAGASYVAPYVDRIDNISGQGTKVVAEIKMSIEQYKFNAKVIAASFKNVQQVHDVSMAGTHAVTVSEIVLEKMLYHPLTDSSVNQFIADWEGQYGKGVTVDQL